MKWLVGLFVVVIFVAKVSALSDTELVQRSLCTEDYQCQDGCRCESTRTSVPKMCFCYHNLFPHGQLYCRRSEYL